MNILINTLQSEYSPLIAFVIVICGISILVILAIYIDKNAERQEHIVAYRTIQIGDSFESVVAKLGDNYTESILKDGTRKCVWRLRNGGSNRVYFRGSGMSTSSYTPVQKITIKFKNNRVISREGLNLDN